MLKLGNADRQILNGFAAIEVILLPDPLRHRVFLADAFVAYRATRPFFGGALTAEVVVARIGALVLLLVLPFMQYLRQNEICQKR